MFAEIPNTSALHKEAARYPYRDSHSRPLLHAAIDPQQLIAAFAAAPPPWVGTQMLARDKLVACAGLKTGSRIDGTPRPPFRIGQHLGVFRIIGLSPSEAILGQEDRHLDFRISLLVDQQRLTVSTLVRPHNVFGVLYLACILPFHHLIVFVTLRRMVRQLKPASAS